MKNRLYIHDKGGAWVMILDRVRSKAWIAWYGTAFQEADENFAVWLAIADRRSNNHWVYVKCPGQFKKALTASSIVWREKWANFPEIPK